MSNPMFSVIVPTHNAQDFIRTGLHSIKQQTYKNYELIIVCDACTDDTPDIALCYADKTLIRNFGRDGLSRDDGIQAATGNWILFMDDDDHFLHEYAFQQLADEISRHDDIDMLSFGYIFRTKGYIEPTPENIFRPRIAHVWASAWKRDTIGTARFGDAIFSSDTYFLRDMRERVQHNALFNMPLYYYNFMRPGSQTDLFCKGIIRQSPVAE